MRISVLNRKLNQAFGGKVTAALEDNCIVLRGTLDRWDDVVRAGQMAATKYSTCHVVNDITFTGAKDAPMHVPALRDRSLDGQTPDVLIIGGGNAGCFVATEAALVDPGVRVTIMEKAEIMRSILKKAGPDTPAKAIAFSLPTTEVAGFGFYRNNEA